MKRQKKPQQLDEQFQDSQALQPEEMTPEQRRKEIARILALGILRLHAIRSKSGQDLTCPAAKNSTDNPASVP